MLSLRGCVRQLHCLRGHVGSDAQLTTTGLIDNFQGLQIKIPPLPTNNASKYSITGGSR